MILVSIGTIRRSPSLRIATINYLAGERDRAFELITKLIIALAIAGAIGFLLLVSFIVSTVLAAIANFFGHLFPQ